MAADCTLILTPAYWQLARPSVSRNRTSRATNRISQLERHFPNNRHARLFRSHAPGEVELSQDVPEQIGEGAFDKMVRIALSDPDGDVRRYSIAVDADWVVGEHIRAFAAVEAS